MVTVVKRCNRKMHTPHFCHGIAYRHRFQACATFKCRVPDSRYGIGYGYLSQAAATGKCPSPIVVTELPIVTVVKPLQPLNAPPPIAVTELPIVTFCKPVQLVKSKLPDSRYRITYDKVFSDASSQHKRAGICSTSSPNTKSVSRLQLENGESKNVTA